MNGDAPVVFSGINRAVFIAGMLELADAFVHGYLRGSIAERERAVWERDEGECLDWVIPFGSLAPVSASIVAGTSSSPSPERDGVRGPLASVTLPLHQHYSRFLVLTLLL
jgi:hypothetical protein